MWEETLVALLARISVLKEPTRWIVDESTLFMALSTFAFQAKSADELRIG